MKHDKKLVFNFNLPTLAGVSLGSDIKKSVLLIYVSIRVDYKIIIISMSPIFMRARKRGATQFPLIFLF